MRYLKSFGLLFGALAYAGTLWAQVNTGTILGTVTDPTGAAVVSAKITAVNQDTGFSRATNSGADGSFLIPLLPIGDRYQLTVEVPGFKTFVRTGIGILLRQNVRVDIQLEIGEVSQRVEVSGAVPMVDTHSTVGGEVIESRRITELPLNGRNPLQLASLVAGVTNIAPQVVVTSGRGANYVNVNGSRQNETDYQLNGIRFAGAYTNSGLNYPNPDALAEFKLITNPNSAEYGIWSGSVFTAVTKSGTNEIHGNLFEFLRNDVLNARNFFATTKPTLKQNQFGASAGGPFIKNRLFGFGSYQGFRIRQTQLASSFPLTAEERQGLITSATPVRDPLSGQPFPTNAQGRYVIPSDRINPVSKNLLDKYVPVAPPGGLIVTTGARKVDVWQLSGKVDWKISDGDQLNVSGLYDKTVPFNPFSLGPYPAYGGADEVSKVHHFSASETHTFSPTVINEFRFGFGGQEETRTPLNQVNPSSLGMQNWNYNYLPENDQLQSPTFNVAGRFNVGGTGFALWVEGGQNWQLTDQVSIQSGKHSMRAGIDFYHREHHLYPNVADTGAFTATGDWTGNPTADFLLGKIGSALRIRYVNKPGYKSWSRGFFFQDDWKVHPRFTLNLGLRWDLLSPFREYLGRDTNIEYGKNIHGGLPVSGLSTWRSGLQSTVFPYAPIGLLFNGDKTPEYPEGLPDTIVPLDWKQIQPRLGLAWDPFGDGKTSVRASFGLFTNAQFADMPAQSNQNLPFITVQSHFMPPGDFVNPYTGLSVYPPFTGGNIANDPNFFLPFLPSAGYGWDPNYRLPRIMATTFNVQREISPGVTLEFGYVGKLSRHLQQTRNINTAIYIPGQSTVANTDSRRRLDNKNFQKIDWLSSDSNASFQSFQSTLRWQNAHGLTLLSSYTWSHSLDTWSTIGIQAVVFQNQENTRLDRGSSDFDRRHVYRLSWVYDLPTPFGSTSSNLLKQILGNWQFTGIMTAQSGSPFGLLSGRDYSLTGTGVDRPDVAGDWELDTNRPRGDIVAQYFNTTAFTRNQDGRFGNLGRNVLTGPGLFNWDLGLFKNILFTERYRLQFRAEFFNAFNQVHLGNPNGSLISPAFGRITSAGDPRFIQFGLKFDF